MTQVKWRSIWPPEGVGGRLHCYDIIIWMSPYTIGAVPSPITRACPQNDTGGKCFSLACLHEL